jgi:hypothetical protein
MAVTPKTPPIRTSRAVVLRAMGVLALLVSVDLYAVTPEPTQTPGRPAGMRAANADAGAKMDMTGSPMAATMASLSLSDRLADYGMREGDPIALVQAAKIRKSLPQEMQSSGPRSVEALLARAEAMSTGNAVVIALARDVRGIRSRSIPILSAGIGLLSKLVKGKSVDRAEVSFRGGEPAMVYVHANGDADLDLYVYDELNNLICVDDTMGPDASCSWRPRWNGSFLVDVRNKKDAEVSYVIALNAAARSASTPARQP